MRPIDADALLQRWNDVVPRMVRDKDGGIPIDFIVVIREVSATPAITLDDPRPKGRWEKFKGTSSGWEQHRCSVCKAEAIFEYTYIDDYDEGIDGEWECIGQKEDGIIEHLTDFCPHCGADMRGG